MAADTLTVRPRIPKPVGRVTEHRIAMLRNQAHALLLHGAYVRRCELPGQRRIFGEDHEQIARRDPERSGRVADGAVPRWRSRPIPGVKTRRGPSRQAIRCTWQSRWNLVSWCL